MMNNFMDIVTLVGGVFVGLIMLAIIVFSVLSALIAPKSEDDEPEEEFVPSTHRLLESYEEYKQFQQLKKERQQLEPFPWNTIMNEPILRVEAYDDSQVKSLITSMPFVKKKVPQEETDLYISDANPNPFHTPKKK